MIVHKITVNVKINDKLKKIFREMYDQLSTYEVNIELKKIRDINNEIETMIDYDVNTISDKLKTLCPIYQQIGNILPENYFDLVNQLTEVLLKNNQNLLLS